MCAHSANDNSITKTQELIPALVRMYHFKQNIYKYKSWYWIIMLKMCLLACAMYIAVVL